MRTAAAISVLVLFTFGCTAFGAPALLGSDRLTTAVGAVTMAEANVPPVPAIRASAAIVVDGDTGQVIWGKNPHQPWPPASMTKMMTALVTLQQEPDLNRVVAVDVDAAQMPGDSVMGLHPGERLTIRDLLYGLLVPSGDDAALALARAVAGSDSAFVALMNQEAEQLGLTDTHFVNPHGLDAPGHLSSAYDLSVIARVAMRNPTFRQIVATRHVVIRGRWVYDLTNTNYFLGRRPDVVGVKTGTTDLALHAITVADQQGNHLLYVVVMHTPDYVPDVTALLDYFRARYRWIDLTLPESPLFEVGTGATRRHLGVEPGFASDRPGWQADTLRWTLDLTPDAPLRPSDNPDLPLHNAGTVTFYAGGDPVARLPLRQR